MIFLFSPARRGKKKQPNEAPLVKREVSKCLTGMHAHIAHVIDRAQVLEDPFPHLIVENFLPADLYKHAGEIWPATKEFAGAKDAKRLVLPVTYGSLEDTDLPKNQKVFWRLFGEVIVNRYLKPKLVEKFKNYLPLKLDWQNHWLFDPLYDTCNLRQDCLILDKDSPNMPPHVDQLNMLAQIIIYFPTDAHHEDLGTIFYYGDPSSTPNDLYEVKSPANIKFAKKIPYHPNMLVVFMQSPTAWHGFERPKNMDPTYQRRLFLSPLFFSPEFMERHYSKRYARSIIDEYFFDHRFLQKKNWVNIWGDDD
jgi:hypothetical protein